MLPPFVSWMLSSLSSSSSSSSEEEEEEEEEFLDINHENEQKFNVEDDENDHFLNSCDVDDTIPVALAVPNASPAVTVAFPAAAIASTVVTRLKGQQRGSKYSGMVRQYQRLWTKEDEMELLKGYLDYIKHHRREAAAAATTTLQNDVASLYDHVRPKLNVGFNQNHLVEKLRRLKRKHKLALDKGRDRDVPFRNPREQAIFEISHKIWGNDTDNNNIIDQDVMVGNESGHTPESRYHVGNVKVKNERVDKSDETDNRVPKRLRLDDDANRTNDQNSGDGIRGFIEETMRSCFSPFLKEVLLDEAQEKPLPELVPIPMLLCPEEVDHEQWRKRKILELEVYVKRLELLQDQIKARLDELRTS